MPEYKDIYSEETIRIIKNGLDRHEYDSLDQLKEALRECRLYSPSNEFWRLTIARFPCRYCEIMLKECERLRSEGRSYESAAELLPSEKRKLWLDYCASTEEKEPEKFVIGFFGGLCLSKPLCRPCTCKEGLIKFFCDIVGGREESVKKNINNWLSGSSVPGSRESCIQLCYALGLRVPGRGSIHSAINANRFLSMICNQNPLYIRDKAELVHYYCLMQPLGGKSGPDEEYDRVKNYRYAQELIKKASARKEKAADGYYTGEARQMIKDAVNVKTLLDLAASCPEDDAGRYQSAKTVIMKFRKDYHDLYDPEGPGDDDDDAAAKVISAKQKEKKKKRKDENAERRPTKEMSLKVIDILTGALSDKKSIELLRRFTKEGFTLSDALYWSGLTKNMVNGTVPVKRDVLMLTLLSSNYGVKYDVDTRSLIDTEDLIDEDELAVEVPDEPNSFNRFYDKITDVLDNCGFAPLHPRRRFDYLVLYSYRCLTIDHDRLGKINALSDYLIRSLEIIGENETEG